MSNRGVGLGLFIWFSAAYLISPKSGTPPGRFRGEGANRPCCPAEKTRRFTSLDAPGMLDYPNISMKATYSERLGS